MAPTALVPGDRCSISFSWESEMTAIPPRCSRTAPLASTREMLFLVSGHEKRDIMRRVLAAEDLPANRAHSDGDLVWLIDRAAAPEQRDAS